MVETSQEDNETYLSPIVYQNLITQYLVVGDFTGFIIALYTQSMGDLFFGVVLLGMSIPLYMKTESIGFVSILWIMVFGILELWIPTPALNLGKVILVIAVGVLLFNTFMRTRG